VYVEHEPVWAPAQLATDLDGNTAPGWECVHLLENGNGTCGGNVFRIEDAVGKHGCLVEDDGIREVELEHRLRELEAENRELRRMVTTFHVWEGEGITLRQHDARIWHEGWKVGADDQKRWSKRTVSDWGGATPNPYGELEAKSD
jgi:hypothetical protein